MMIFQQLLVFLFLLFCSPSTSTIISLAGDDWTITDGGNYTAQGVVPGTIHTILFKANKIPEPYMGYNDVNLRDLVRRSWIFTKNFSLSQEFLAFNEVTLHLKQIDTVANITLNGCPIGDTKSMFIAYQFNATPCIHLNNQLQISFESPVNYAFNQFTAYNATYNELVQPENPPPAQHGEGHIQFIRKEPCSFSWDWGPAFAPIGIPGDIFLEGVNTTNIAIRLDSVNIASHNGTNTAWQVDVMLSSNNDQFTSQLKFVLVNTSWTFETNVTFNKNLSVSLIIPDMHVLLWWPNGYGDQPIYQLSVFNQGQEIGSRLIGFRTVELVETNYSPGINGTSFYFAINSKAIFIKGSNWIPSDAFQERVSDDKLERLLRSAQLANMNMLRIWGGGIYERNSFYEIADRLGIMLWHDFMFACSLYPVDEPFLANVYDEVVYQVKRLQSHPSIVLWSGNNENEAAVAQNWYHISNLTINRTKDEYRKLYVDTVMTAVKQVDKGNNRPFVISSPSNGQETIKENYIAKDPQDPRYGDVHFYGYKNDSWDPTTYPITRFLSETGIQSLPSLDAWHQVTTDVSDLNFESPFILHREHKENETDAMMLHIEFNLPLPMTNESLKRFTQMIYLSQINQAVTLKSISDVCRLHSSIDMIDPKTSEGNTMGLMYWQINDIWQAPTWSTIEYGLKWKMGHYYVKHMYEPVYPIVTLTPYLADVADTTATVSFYVVNELFTGSHGQLMCSIHKLNTTSVDISFAYDVLFDSPGVQHVGTLPYSTLMKRARCASSSQCIIHCSYTTNQGRIGQTLFLDRPKNYQLSNPNLQVATKQLSPSDFEITLTVSHPALFVWLDIPANTTGYFSRNGFHMFEPTTTVEFHLWTPLANFTGANFDLNVTSTSLFDVTLA